jgi:hypothetical protein
MASVADYNVANASGASVRSDINNILQAVVTLNSGTSEPSTMYPFMLWIDTTNNLVKMRNGANDAWLTMPLSMSASNQTSGDLTVNGDFGVSSSLPRITLTDTDGGYHRINGVGTNLIIQADEGNTEASSTIQLHIDGDEHARLVNGGQFVVGHTSSISNGLNAKLQAYDAGAEGSLSLGRWGASASPPFITFMKSRNATVGSHTIVSDGDNIGEIRWRPSDGVNFTGEAASISAKIDGTPGADDLPGELIFATTSDGSDSPTTKMVIKSDGKLGLGTTSPDWNMQVESASNTVIAITSGTTSNAQIRFGDSGDDNIGMINYDNSSDSLAFTTNASERIRILSGGGLTFNGDTSTDNALDDYEQGVWTPVYAGVTTAGTYTYSTRYGSYIKVGNLVTVWCNLNSITDTSEGSGAVSITGLPYNGLVASSGGVAWYPGSCVLEYFNVASDCVNLAVAVNDATDQVRFWETRDNNINDTVAITDRASNNADIWFSVTYRTA